jgi:predicted enzyme related to lactoylglutathione lyase
VVQPEHVQLKINYRIDDLFALLAQLKRNGVEIVRGSVSDENGKFAWIMDPDGNKLELLEPMVLEEEKIESEDGGGEVRTRHMR